MWYSPAFATVSLSGSIAASTSGSGLKIPGSSTWTSCSMRGATTMKMMSSTSTTSTSGVTLMSGLTASSGTLLRHSLTARSMAFALRPVLDAIEKLAGGAVQCALVARDLSGEIVVGEHRRDGDAQPEGGLDERLADAGRDRRETARSGGG